MDAARKVASTMRRWSVGAFNIAEGAVGRPNPSPVRDAANAAAGGSATAVPVSQGRVVSNALSGMPSTVLLLQMYQQ